LFRPLQVRSIAAAISFRRGLFCTGGVASNALLATFTDDGGTEPVGNYHAAIDWGDGVTTAGSVALSGGVFQILGSHTYSRAGSVTIGVAIQDDGGSMDAVVEQASIQLTTHQDHQEYWAPSTKMC
jgi:hypothetical protein